MRHLYYLFFLIIIIEIALFAPTCKADTIVWSGNIEINANQLFTQQQTLKVLPGTVITSYGAHKIEIRGNMLAEGTNENPIIFTANDTIGLYDSATIAGGWHGIHLLNNNTGYARFTHCRFEYGKANIPGSWYGNGGWHDTLSGNQGGVFWIRNYHAIEFNSCVFFYNYSRTSGGALYCDNIQSIKISNCEFLQNKTMLWGGGICCNNHDSLFVSNTTFKLNIAMHTFYLGGWEHFHGSGSAIYLFTDYPDNSYNIINNNSFFNNTSTTAISFEVTNSIFINNLIANNFNNNVLTFNRLESTHHVFNNTIANNWWFTNIPGVYSGSEDLRFYNNIMWNNMSSNVEDDDLAVNWDYYQPYVDYCLIWDGRAVGDNIITKDPLFVSPAPNYGLESNGWEYDWTLLDNSPAVNAGTPDTSGLDLPLFDLANNPRVFGNRIDMGAYENQHVYVKINDEPFNDYIRLYPNPGTDKLYIQLDSEIQDCFFDLFNGQGNRIMHHKIEKTSSLLRTNNLPTGVYHYIIYNQNKVLKNGSWVKF